MDPSTTTPFGDVAAEEEGVVVQVTPNVFFDEHVDLELPSLQPSEFAETM